MSDSRKGKWASNPPPLPCPPPWCFVPAKIWFFLIYISFSKKILCFSLNVFLYCQGSAIPERYFRPVCFPMAMCWLFGTLSYLLPLVFDSLYVVLPVFIMFTFYRSFLFAIGIAFVTEAWVWIFARLVLKCTCFLQNQWKLLIHISYIYF